MAEAGESSGLDYRHAETEGSVGSAASEGCNKVADAIQFDNNTDDDNDGAIRSNEITVQYIQEETEIFSAVRANYCDRIQQIVQNGHNVNQVCKAEADAKPAVVQAQIETTDEDRIVKSIQMTGYTPLHVAAIHSSLQTIKCLLLLGADVNARDKNGRTPLQNAVTVGRYRTASLLIEAGADLNTQSSSQKTPLFEAILIKRLDLVQLLLQHAANPDTPDINGTTPLSKAVMQCAAPNGPKYMPPIIQALLDAGCEVDKTGPGGGTALMQCAGVAKNADIIHMLIKAGADVNKLDSAGNNPFNLCAAQGQRNLTAVKALMLCGAATHLPNNKGETPLSKCLKYGSISVLRLLLSADAVPHSSEILTAPRIEQVRKIVPEFDQYLLEEFCQPRSLLRLCREVVRNSLSPFNLPKVPVLELPTSLCNFVLGDFRRVQ